jgi:hypothetical protein
MSPERLAGPLTLVGVPLLIAIVAVFLGMFLPIGFYEITHSESFQPHNVFWESVFGLGFYVAGFIADCFTTRWVAVVGLLAWPLFAAGIVFFVSRRVILSSQRVRFVWSAVFLLSVVVIVGDTAENYLSVHHVPLYWNLYATCY